jgi:hypothetical protein
MKNAEFWKVFVIIISIWGRFQKVKIFRQFSLLQSLHDANQQFEICHFPVNLMRPETF